MHENENEKPLVYLKKLYFFNDVYRYGLFLDGNLIVTFSLDQRFRACMAVQNLYFAIYHDNLDPLNVIVYE